MFLQRLSEYADQIDLPPPMYREAPIRYVIQLDSRGQFLNMLDRKTEGSKRGPVMLVPDCKRAFAIKPKLLADNAEYTLGIGREGASNERVARQHVAYTDLVRVCARQTDDPAVRAVLAFLDRLDETPPWLPDGFDPGETIAFQVTTNADDSPWPVQHRAVQRFWAREAAATDDEEDGTRLQCLVCGEIRPCAKRLAINIRGIPGNPMGMALISANSDAFLSYGLEASLIAPTCEECGLRFGNALNALLADERTHLRVGDSQYIFWTQQPTGFSWATILTQPKSEQAREFLKAAWRSKPQQAVLDTTRFYAAALSGAKSRVIVRDWLETTLASAQETLLRYFHMQRLVGFDGQEHWFALPLLAQATVNAKSKVEEPAPSVGQALLRLALHGDLLPEWLLYQAVRRARAEQTVRAEHVALIKMVILSRPGELEERGDMAELNANLNSAAYQCGRLLAELEDLQKQALGFDINATIVDRFFGTASSAPASVFGRLLRGAQAHLGKLRTGNEGAYVAIQARLEEILEKLDGFPSTLSLRDQGFFALGYYHQRAAHAKARRERRAAATAAIASQGASA